MNSSVEHPAHYCQGRKYEPKDVIRDWELGFSLGNAVKYIARAGRKQNAVEDLHKAIFYINDEIEALKKNEQVAYTTPDWVTKFLKEECSSSDSTSTNLKPYNGGGVYDLATSDTPGKAELT